MSVASKPVAKPQIRLREESDNWVILFDPDTGSSRVLNPIGVFIWRILDGTHAVSDIVEQVREYYANAPQEVEQQVTEFIEVLKKKGFVETNSERTAAS
ncbi:MAG: PqqD family peptide modification chaperone [Desulfomonilaceae bacterium]